MLVHFAASAMAIPTAAESSRFCCDVFDARRRANSKAVYSLFKIQKVLNIEFNV